MPTRIAPWLVVLSLVLAAPLAAQPPADDAPGSFRHYPGGKVVPNLTAGLPPLEAGAALRADADAQLPEGFRLRDDGEPLVTPVGRNRVFHFGLEYRGVKLADGTDYVAIVGANGRVLASRFRRVPSSVEATVATVDPATALAVAAGHARAALGQIGDLSTTTPVLEIWVDAQEVGRLCWAIVVREASGGSVRAATRYHVAAIGSPGVLEWADVIRYDTLHVQADVWALSPNQPTVVMSLSDVRPVINGAQAAGLTDEDGNLVVPVILPGFLSVSLQGPLWDPLESTCRHASLSIL